GINHIQRKTSLKVSVGLLAGSARSLAAACGLLMRTYPQYTEGMKLAPNYLERAGYRLPTEAEREYACRAEAVASRYYGEADELLGKYAWYLENAAGRTWPVGTKKPNDFGLFDMHGHVWNWCQESYHVYQEGRVYDDREDSLPVKREVNRALRGAAFSQ